MNQKGFTLVELLGVVVILGIVLNIAIPAVTKYIDSSQRETFATILHEYVNAVQNGMASDEYSPPVNPNQVTIVSLDLIPLDKGDLKSSYQSEWIKSKSYVAVINTGTSDNVHYEYYVAGQDKKDHAIALTKIEDINRDQVISDAKNKMEVTIQSLCGNSTGKRQTLSTIKGLETKQPTNDKNQKIDWQAVIYSSKNCAS